MNILTEAITALLNFTVYLIPASIWKGLVYLFIAHIILKILYTYYKKYLSPHMGPWFEWGDKCARVFGWPCFLIILFTAFTRITFTATCISVGYRCEYAVGVAEAYQNSMSALVSGSSDMTQSNDGKFEVVKNRR